MHLHCKPTTFFVFLPPGPYRSKCLIHTVLKLTTGLHREGEIIKGRTWFQFESFCLFYVVLKYRGDVKPIERAASISI